MSNRLKPANKKAIPGPKARKTTTGIWWPRLKGLFFLIGVLVSIMAFLPRPSVSVGDPVDPDNPFSSTFTVSNGNWVPLADVSVGIGGPGFLEFEGNRVVNVRSSGFMAQSAWLHHDLGTDEKFTITLSDIFATSNSDLQRADIRIVVKYKPWLIPLQRSKVFRYEAHRQTNGKFYWYALPLR
jgi:hypothetical protein